MATAISRWRPAGGQHLQKIKSSPPAWTPLVANSHQRSERGLIGWVLIDRLIWWINWFCNCLVLYLGGITDVKLIRLNINNSWLKQILRTRAESQRIVAARPLYRLQYPVRAKSSTKDLPRWRLEFPCLAAKPIMWIDLTILTVMLLHLDEPNVSLGG